MQINFNIKSIFLGDFFSYRVFLEEKKNQHWDLFWILFRFFSWIISVPRSPGAPRKPWSSLVAVQSPSNGLRIFSISKNWKGSSGSPHIWYENVSRSHFSCLWGYQGPMPVAHWRDEERLRRAATAVEAGKGVRCRRRMIW